jgi:hypothetical protein
MMKAPLFLTVRAELVEAGMRGFDKLSLTGYFSIGVECSPS